MFYIRKHFKKRNSTLRKGKQLCKAVYKAFNAVHGFYYALHIRSVGKAYAAGISEGFAGHYRNIGFFKQQ